MKPSYLDISDNFLESRNELLANHLRLPTPLAMGLVPPILCAKISDNNANFANLYYRWKLVIHGGIDGYSRRIVYLQCCTDNKASTVFQLFHEGVTRYGLPVRVRSDKGGENTDIAWFMLNHPQRGPENSSHITGRSVHNQRIERLWRDVYSGWTYLYYNLFYEMEEQGILDPDNELHILVLRTVFQSRINRDLTAFTQGFNNSPIRTAGNKSPNQLWYQGLLEGKGPSEHDAVCCSSCK